MAVSMIEGTIEEVDESRSPPIGNATINKRVTWDSAQTGGSLLKRFVVDRSMNRYIEPGISGKFYRCNAIDQKGIYAYRGVDGESHYAWPGGARYMGIWMTILGFLLVVLIMFTQNGLALLGILVGGFGIALLVIDSQNRMAGEKLFDAGARPDAAP